MTALVAGASRPLLVYGKYACVCHARDLMSTSRQAGLGCCEIRSSRLVLCLDCMVTDWIFTNHSRRVSSEPGKAQVGSGKQQARQGTTAANERLRSVFETERQTFPIESAGHVGLTPLRKPLLECLFQHSNSVGDPS
ncbi:hypothetical protein PCASD_17568 [Puccinia coronata f. sp. avenae]|uniref:Uncharacterized protein n=1 Tax=Puccinia coronata f. sp. avenae TaxID=200324 RepID=A0A2N5U5V7_9BASI|nr:hypothetical protein PCASD_17568 [Puccinia coronata f. sp. avenae]